jgi:hypothetical protein
LDDLIEFDHLHGVKPLTDLYLRIAVGKHEYEFDVAVHDDETESGKCHMVVSLNSATKLQALLREKKGRELKVQLMERMTGHCAPVEAHHALRVVRASPITSLLDASVVGGGEVVADIRG